MYFHLDIGIKYPFGIFSSVSLYLIEINWGHELNGYQVLRSDMQVHIDVFTMEIFTGIEKNAYSFGKKKNAD